MDELESFFDQAVTLLLSKGRTSFLAWLGKPSRSNTTAFCDAFSIIHLD